MNGSKQAIDEWIDECVNVWCMYQKRMIVMVYLHSRVCCSTNKKTKQDSLISLQ